MSGVDGGIARRRQPPRGGPRVRHDEVLYSAIKRNGVDDSGEIFAREYRAMLYGPRPTARKMTSN